MTKPRKSAEFWSRLVREAEARGEPLREVARRHGVHDKTLGWWRAKLAGERRRVTLVRMRTSAQGERRVRLVVRGVTVELGEGVEPGYVAALVRALAV